MALSYGTLLCHSLISPEANSQIQTSFRFLKDLPIGASLCDEVNAFTNTNNTKSTEFDAKNTRFNNKCEE